MMKIKRLLSPILLAGSLLLTSFVSVSVPAQAQVVPVNGALQITCSASATGRFCVAAIPAGVTFCNVTNTGTSSLTAQFQVATDNGTTYQTDPYINNGVIGAVGAYSGQIPFPPNALAPTTIAINVSAYVSGTATFVVVCTSTPQFNPYPSVGLWNGAEPAGAGNTVLFARAGFVGSINITVAGTTGNTTCYDNATTNTGNIVAIINGTTAQATNVAGVIITINRWVVNGFTCAGAASSPAFLVGYS
jgi:hypothetical protein